MCDSSKNLSVGFNVQFDWNDGGVIKVTWTCFFFFHRTQFDGWPTTKRNNNKKFDPNFILISIIIQINCAHDWTDCSFGMGLQTAAIHFVWSKMALDHRCASLQFWPLSFFFLYNHSSLFPHINEVFLCTAFCLFVCASAETSNVYRNAFRTPMHRNECDKSTQFVTHLFVCVLLQRVIRCWFFFWAIKPSVEGATTKMNEKSGRKRKKNQKNLQI